MPYDEQFENHITSSTIVYPRVANHRTVGCCLVALCREDIHREEVDRLVSKHSTTCKNPVTEKVQFHVVLVFDNPSKSNPVTLKDNNVDP